MANYLMLVRKAMDLIAELIKQGTLGAVAGIFFWLYLQERKDKNSLQKSKDDLMEARRLDAAETRKDVTDVLPGISQSLETISSKIEIIQSRRRK